MTLIGYTMMCEQAARSNWCNRWRLFSCYPMGGSPSAWVW